MVTIIVTIDLFFCGLCLYIVAMYKDLQKVLGNIDQYPIVMLNNCDNAHGHRQELRDCIEFHLAIIR